MERQNKVENTSQNCVQENDEKVLDLGLIVKKLWHNRRMFFIVLPIVFCLSALFIFTIPRYYTTSTSLAPELESSSSSGGLSSLASSFGFDLSSLESSDAITPLLYPDLMSDNKFVADMFKIHVKASKEPIDTDYYTYLKKYRKTSPLAKVVGGIRMLFKSNEENVKLADKDFNPYILTKDDDDIVGTIRHDVVINVDKKTGVISIAATAQDPLVCKILADSVTARLQVFITKYRTSKAQLEADYYKKLMQDAQKSYERVRAKYAAYSDANTDVMLQSVKSKLEDMENDMQLKYNQYTTYNTQYQASLAKVLERTPAFTTLKGADVPIRPTGPKRVIFVLAMSFLAFVITSLYVSFIKK